MPTFYPNPGTILLAGTLKTLLHLSKVRLFQSTISPDVTTDEAALAAAEATFTGYTPGGELVTDFLDPLLYPLGGSSISAPTVQFQADNPITTTNNIGGWWLETAGGDLVAIGTFPAPIPISAPNQGIPINITLVFGNGL